MRNSLFCLFLLCDSILSRYGVVYLLRCFLPVGAVDAEGRVRYGLAQQRTDPDASGLKGKTGTATYPPEQKMVEKP